MRTGHLLAFVVFLPLLFPSWVMTQELVRAPAPAKPEQKPPKSLSGLWSGSYSYPGNGQADVKFQMVVIQDGKTVAGFLKEPATFGNQTDPWLHAVVKGSFDKKAGKLTFTKTYDGTGGVNHDVEYEGKLSEDGSKIEGTWTLGQAGGAGLSGSFTVTRQRLDKAALADLK